MQSKPSPMSVKLSDAERERLKILGKARHRSPHWLAKEAISQYLDREEAAERFKQESLAAWDEYERTGRSVPNEQVMEWLDSWGKEDEDEAPSCE